MSKLNFFRTNALPKEGVIGSLYFIHDDSNQGVLYVCTEKGFEKYDTKVASGDLILSLDADQRLASELSLDFNSNANTITLYGKTKHDGTGKEVISTIDASDFIINGMIEDADVIWCSQSEDQDGNPVYTPSSKDDENAILCLHFNVSTKAGTRDIYIPSTNLTTSTEDIVQRVDDVEFITSAALNTLNKQVKETSTRLDDNEFITSAALNHLNKKVKENELVTSASLNDLNQRIEAVYEYIQEQILQATSWWGF